MHFPGKKVAIAALAVVLTAACAILGFLLSRPGTQTADAPQEESVTQIQIKALPKGAKSTLPEPVRSTRIYLQEDLPAQQSTDAFMQKIAETGFNSVVFFSARTSPAFSADGACSDTLREAIAAAREKGLYSAIRVTGNDADCTAQFASDSGADCLILSDDTQLADLDTRLKQTSVSSLLTVVPFSARITQPSADMSLHCGYYIDIPSDADSDSLYACKQAAGEGALLWFSVQDEPEKDKSGYDRLADGFNALTTVLETDGATADTSFVFCPFADFSSDETCVRIVKAGLTAHILPESFRKSFRITNHDKTTITTTESKVTFTGECSPMHPLTCNNAPVTVTSDGFFSVEYDLSVGKNTFAFTHQGKTVTYQVQYNLDLIRSISPSGKLTTPGGNALEIAVVAHRRANVYATLNGSRITLTSSDALMSNEGVGHIDSNSDYVTYLGKYNLPESSANSFSLGAIQAYATYNGMSDSITGATVTVTAAEKVGALPVVEDPTVSSITVKPTTAATTAATTEPVSEEEESESGTDADASESESESEPKTTGKPIYSAPTTSTTTTQAPGTTGSQKLDPVLTPYQNHGIAGTKRMCVVKTYYTETMPLSPLNDLSVPLSTPLLQGTFDFITGESSFDKYTYYNLGSGRRVYRKDVDVIENAYAMPANTISLVSSGTSGNSTDINLHLKWKVPFNVITNGQRYINDPKNKREYAVTAFNANSLDITFYYTADASGQPNVTGSGVISSCEWVQSASAQTYTLRLHLRNAARFYGYSFSYNADDTLRISIKERASASVAGKTVMLDPGHGGTDGGAGCAVNSSTYNEAKINLALCEKVRAKLQAMGANVVMTRTDNSDLKIDTRKRMARQNRPDVFVSIHCDAATSSSATGTTGYYYRNYSQALAKSIHTQLVNTYSSTIYGTNKGITIDRGTVFYPFSVTRIEECPSVLIEVGYVTNLTECKILQNSQNQDALATAIANGIRDYYAQN